MVQYGLRIALAGGVFFFIQVWEGVRARRSYAKYLDEKENGRGLMTLGQYLEGRKQSSPGPSYLNVKSFSIENLEGAKAPSNNMQ